MGINGDTKVNKKDVKSPTQPPNNTAFAYFIHSRRP